MFACILSSVTSILVLTWQQIVDVCQVCHAPLIAAMGEATLALSLIVGFITYLPDLELLLQIGCRIQSPDLMRVNTLVNMFVGRRCLLRNDFFNLVFMFWFPEGGFRESTVVPPKRIFTEKCLSPRPFAKHGSRRGDSTWQTQPQSIIGSNLSKASRCHTEPMIWGDSPPCQVSFIAY